MKKAIPCAAMLLLACSLTAYAAEKREQTYRVGADVDAKGHITATQVDPNVPASIAAVLNSAVKQWQFVPATLSGRPVPAHTFIRTKLQALPNASGQYDLRISFMGNGPRLDNRTPPRYPADALSRRQAAFLILDATVQPNGHLTDMKVSNKFADWPVPPSFKVAVLAAAKQWHAIPEQVDGQPVATQLRIPFIFTVDGQTYTAQQTRILREAARMHAAAADAETAQPAIPLPSEQEVALDSPLHPSAVATITNAP
ncbi:MULTISPECIES: energy transducer TonB [unclassified Rhodanobacter]|uniref:energy transducer TonB n=1 Tax=unclassified Rhodanobacter TaxID=2621553 RepID=UPI001BDE2498|nr:MULTISPECIES: energy transducer TonB [unclassified Rhodanobacter]MBT2144006.1 energy transducer TonB [Rhodanobacter sp. LX-99]MBT2146920.1 energy transducer TonB [Rhodanobacter sp. LX-100]